VKITGITSVVAATAATGIVCAPFASADTTVQSPEITSQPLGSQAKLVDGAVVQGWTITDLKPSSDVIPHTVNGTLWEATATDQAIQGSATPIVSNLNARATDGQNYRALFGAATPQGVNPSTLAPGQQTSGKVYFDVTGATPESVVYNAGGQDLLVWIKPAPSASRSSTPSSSYPSGGYSSESPTTAAPAATTATPGAEEIPAEPAVADTVPPVAGSLGTPIPEGSQGTPLPAGSQGTPVAPPAEGAPVPASVVPQPVSQGTPLPPGADQAPTPTTYTPAPTP
jgi:hypothetical protein